MVSTGLTWKTLPRRDPLRRRSAHRSQGATSVTDTKPTQARWITGRAQPPLWLRLFGVVAFTAAAAALGVRRGVAVGFVAAVVYGFIALPAAVAWERTVAWSKQHPLLDSLVIIPLLSLALAYRAHLSIGLCVVVAVLAGGLLVGLSAVLRRRRRSRT